MSSAGKNIRIINQFAGTPESGWGEWHYYLSRYWMEQGYSVKIIPRSFNYVFIKFPQTDAMGEKGYQHLMAKHDVKVLAARFTAIFEERNTVADVAIATTPAPSLTPA